MDTNPNALPYARANGILKNTGLTYDCDTWKKGIGYKAPGGTITRTSEVTTKPYEVEGS